MKPAQIVLLVVLGAIGGAVVMKVTQRAPAPPAVAQVQVKEMDAAPQPPAAAPAPEPAKPSPVEPTASPVTEPEAVQAPRVAKSRTAPVTRPAVPRPVASRPVISRPVEVARNEAPVVVAAPSNPPLAPARETAAPPDPPTLPARPEPENVTPASRPPEPHTVTLNAGMLLPVRLVDGLSSERNLSGDTFTATLDKELVVDGFVIAERGARVQGRVVASDRGGKVKGVSALAVELTQLYTADGQKVALRTDSFERHGEQTQTQDAAKVGGGAALGAIIGAIAGGGKGAAIGAGVGGAAGAGDVLLTRGKPATLPSETRINFRLSSAVTITERR